LIKTSVLVDVTASGQKRNPNFSKVRVIGKNPNSATVVRFCPKSFFKIQKCHIPKGPIFFIAIKDFRRYQQLNGEQVPGRFKEIRAISCRIFSFFFGKVINQFLAKSPVRIEFAIYPPHFNENGDGSQHHAENIFPKHPVVKKTFSPAMVSPLVVRFTIGGNHINERPRPKGLNFHFEC
jgi:hypothetical protein